MQYSIWQAVYSYLDRLLIQVICGNLVTTNHNLVQNVVQTCQFVSRIEYNQPTQNIIGKNGTLSIYNWGLEYLRILSNVKQANEMITHLLYLWK